MTEGRQMRERKRVGEQSRKRSDKTDSGELKLICFFDDSRTPRIWFKILAQHFWIWFLFHLCPHNTDLLLSLSTSIYLQIYLLVYSSFFFFQALHPLSFTAHTDRCILPTPICVSDVLSFLQFLAFNTLYQPLSLLVFASIFFMCPFIFSFSSPLPSSVLTFLISPSHSFFPLLCTLSFCLSVTFSPPFLPFSPFSILSFLSFLLASSLSLFSFSEMYYCHLVFKKGTTATLSLINGTGKPTPTLFYSSSSPLHQQ